MLLHNTYIKFLFFASLFFVLKLPLNNFDDVIFFILAIFFIIFFKTQKKSHISYLYIIPILIILVTINILDKKRIDEAHSVFFSKSDIDILSTFLPNNIILDIEKDYNDSFDLKRALKSYDSNAFSSEINFKKNNFIEKPFAYSSENFFYNSKFTRKVDYINFDSREDLKIEQINTIDFNLVFDKELRRSLPYYVLFKLPSFYNNSKICAEGNIYFSYTSNDNLDIQKIDFKKLKDDCIKLKKDFKTFFILGYSIDNDDQLKIKLEKKYDEYLVLFILLLLKILFFILFYKIYFTWRMNSRVDYIVFFLSIISTLLLFYLKDPNLLTGLRYFRGGADGLFHEYQGYKILENLKNNNFYLTLRGGADLFYFMPGLRYFIAVFKLIFGANSYGYMIIGAMLPFFLYRLLKNLISERISFYLIISFLIFPIFENIGFGHFNYIHQIVRNHAETLSIFLIIFVLSEITKNSFVENVNYEKIFLYCLILSLSTFCRPNFLPTTSLIFIYLFIMCFRKNYILSFYAIFGYSFVFLSLIHNIYFGEKIILFTQSNVHFVFNDTFQILNFKNIETNIFIDQFLKWNPLYNIHRLVMLFFIFFWFIYFEKNSIRILLILILISQHFVLLLTHPDSRYAYLAWLITFITFFYYLFNYYLKKLK